MPAQQRRGHREDARLGLQGKRRQERAEFKRHGIIDGAGDGGSPREGTVAENQRARNVLRVQQSEGLADDFSRLALIVAADLLLAERTCHQNFPVEKVRVGRAERRNRPAGLREYSRLRRMRSPAPNACAPRDDEQQAKVKRDRQPILPAQRRGVGRCLGQYENGVHGVKGEVASRWNR